MRPFNNSVILCLYLTVLIIKRGQEMSSPHIRTSNASSASRTKSLPIWCRDQAQGYSRRRDSSRRTGRRREWSPPARAPLDSYFHISTHLSTCTQGK